MAKFDNITNKFFKQKDKEKKKNVIEDNKNKSINNDSKEKNKEKKKMKSTTKFTKAIAYSSSRNSFYRLQWFGWSYVI